VGSREIFVVDDVVMTVANAIMILKSRRYFVYHASWFFFQLKEP